MSAMPSSCFLHEKLQTHCGSSRDKESFVLLSESNSNISAHLTSCHLSKCGDITKAELTLRRGQTIHKFDINYIQDMDDRYRISVREKLKQTKQGRYLDRIGLSRGQGTLCRATSEGVYTPIWPIA